MKFFQWFIVLLAASAVFLYVGLSIAMHWIINALIIFGGILLLAIDVFAMAVWLVNWKYYSD